MAKNKTIKLNKKNLIVVYATPSFEKISRVTVNDNLGKGKPTYHISGYSYQFTVSLEILIKQNSDMFNYLNEKLTLNEYVKIVSTFPNIPTGKYFIGKLTIKYYDRDYLHCEMELLWYNGQKTSELNKKVKSTEEAITSDKNSIYNKVKKKKNKRCKKGETDSKLVKKIQKALRSLSFYNGKINGKYDKTVEKSVKKLQKKFKYKQTGIVDLKTAKILDLKKKVYNKKSKKYEYKNKKLTYDKKKGKWIYK